MSSKMILDFEIEDLTRLIIDHRVSKNCEILIFCKNSFLKHPKVIFLRKYNI
mgnify:CR=1 FL=1